MTDHAKRVMQELQRRLPETIVDNVFDDGEVILVHVIAPNNFAKAAEDLERAASEITQTLDVDRAFLLEVASGWRK